MQNFEWKELKVIVIKMYSDQRNYEDWNNEKSQSSHTFAVAILVFRALSRKPIQHAVFIHRTTIPRRHFRYWTTMMDDYVTVARFQFSINPFVFVLSSVCQVLWVSQDDQVSYCSTNLRVSEQLVFSNTVSSYNSFISSGSAIF